MPAPGRRTVPSLLRITGRSRERRFVNYHRVLSRAAWSPRAGARVLLGLLDAFVPNGPSWGGAKPRPSVKRSARQSGDPRGHR